MLFLKRTATSHSTPKLSQNTTEVFAEDAVLGGHILTRLKSRGGGDHEAFQCKDWPRLAELMDANFELRRSVYTDDCLGPGNLKMVQLARQFNSAVKLPGSGGAVVGLCLDPDRLMEMKRAFQEAGCVFCLIVPHGPTESGVQSSK